MKKYIISVGSGVLVLAFAYLISNFIMNFNKVEQSLVSESAILVKVMGQNLAIVQIDVLTVVEMEELEQIKVFLQSNKLALNVLVVEKK